MSLFYCNKCKSLTNIIVCYICGNSTEHATLGEIEQLNKIKFSDPIKEKLVEALKWDQCWLKAALECKSWYWDSDQWAGAKECYDESERILADYEKEKL